MSENEKGGADTSVEVKGGFLSDSHMTVSAGASGKPTVEEFGSKRNLMADVGPDGKATVKAPAEEEKPEGAPEGDVAETDPEAPETEGAEETTEEETPAEPEREALDKEDLGEWNPEDEEVSAKWDKKYTNEDGTLRLEAFNASRERMLAEGKNDITPAERQFLKDRYKISDAVINQHMDGLARTEAATLGSLYSVVGGEEAYNSMVDWAKETYTQKQKDRFNNALKSNDMDAIEEQLTLLKQRASAAGIAPSATPTKQAPPAREPVTRKTVSGKGAPASPSVEGFKDNAEFMKANSAAKTPEDFAAVKKRLAASPWFKDKHKLAGR